MGAAGDQAHVVVQSFGPGVVHAELNGGQDSLTEFADGLGGLDEGVQARPGGFRAPPFEQLHDTGGVQVSRGFCAKGLLEGVRTPNLSSAVP
jgi:hypothetical protein